MDNREDHGKNHTLGHEGSGVHICHKCGWPFPNPHPSARHRRAHKKICGTIDGYTLADSRGSDLSDDEHLSDEDHKTPSRQVLERSNDEIKSAGSGERTNRSEDDAFVDAVTEFSDSGSGKGIEGSSDDAIKPARSIQTSFTNDSKTALSFEDDAITAVVPPSKSSADSSQNAESHGNNLYSDALESENQPSHVTIGSMGSPTTDCGNEESGLESIDDKLSSISDMNPIQLENRGYVSQENLKKRAREDLSVIDVMGNNENNKKRNAVDDLMVTDTKGNEKAIQTSEAVLMLGKTEDLTSDQVAADGVVESKQQYDDELGSKTSLNVPSSEVDAISSTQINVPDTGEMASEGSGKLTEIANETGEVNDNFHVFSVPVGTPALKNPEMMIEGYKDHRAGSIQQFVDIDSFEVIKKAPDSMDKVNPSNPFSSLSDEGEELFASGTDISKDNIPEEVENSEHVKDSLLEVRPSSLSEEGEQLFASYNQQEGGNRENDVEKPLDETELGATQVKEAVNQGQIKEDSCVLTNTDANDIEKSGNVQCPQEWLPDDYNHNLSELISLEHDIKASELVGSDGTADKEISRIDTAKSEEVKGIAEESYGKMTATPENLGILSEGKVHERNDLSEAKNASDSGNDLVGSNYGFEIETRGGDPLFRSVDGDTLMNTTDIAKDLHETSKNVVTSEIDISEPEFLLSNKASDSQEHGTNENGEVMLEDSTVSVGDSDELFKLLNNAADVQILQKPSDKIDDFALSSIQKSDAIVDDPAKDFVEAAPENQTDEGDNKLVTRQLGASATDFSADSGSQTDSLEGHWGSVSVLSTQSDMQAAVDTEPLTSAGEKAADVKKPKKLTEESQQTDKSDMFEPPSFMTLVEPSNGDKAAEIQTAQNLQQPKEAQAGWFPSLTNVVNESQGRKKNEEMIAKVTNWTTGKQHAPLKNLLSEYNTENKSKLPSPKETQPPLMQKDELKPTASPQMNIPEPVTKDDASKEWNSPARYPADIKREKRKVKGRPYWAQFMCCSSVN